MNYTEQFKHSRHVRMSSPILTKDINNIYGKYWNSIKHAVFGMSEIRARMGSLPTPWGASSGALFTLPPFISTNDRLCDLIDARAVEIIQEATKSNKRIELLYSGGIDSTLVLAALIKNSSQDQLSNITVLMTPSGIFENYNFYVNFIHNKIQCEPYHRVRVSNDYLNKTILLHGDPGDCLFGPSIAMFEKMIPSGDHLRPWKDNLDIIVANIEIRAKKSKGMPEGFSQWYTDKITNNLLEVQPPDVDSIADWWWWHYYNFKWEFSIWRPFFRLRADPKEPITAANIESYVRNTFFNTDKFQQWSWSNLQTHVPSIKDHKIQAKQYIFELDGDLEYFNHKIKIDSAPRFWENAIHPMYYDNDWVGHYLTESGVKETALHLLENYKG